MPNMSTLTLIGHLGRDAETRFLANETAIVSFSVAFTRKRKDTATTTWFRCNWFGDRAVKVAQYLTKGKAVCVTGEVYQSEYTDKASGATKTALEVDVRDVVLLGDGKAEGGQEQAPATGKPERQHTPYMPPVAAPRRPAPAPVGDDEPPF